MRACVWRDWDAGGEVSRPIREADLSRAHHPRSRHTQPFMRRHVDGVSATDVQSAIVHVEKLAVGCRPAGVLGGGRAGCEGQQHLPSAGAGNGGGSGLPGLATAGEGGGELKVTTAGKIGG